MSPEKNFAATRLNLLGVVADGVACQASPFYPPLSLFSDIIAQFFFCKRNDAVD